ncbi:hypothetical protein MN116_002711 [Schistosoma mekongi]|uniref:Fibronectin type-III domain-containing protein n=1 Tax=Schistosoma mekongi TaxID=38744 RepID=A0AAE1ZGF3_SCHME|nr:hypothetical protein MN116_002711 [Schistosoma mekongi]
MLLELKRNMSEKADDGYSLLSYLQILPGYSDNRRLKVKWDWSSTEVAQNLLQQAKILYYNDLDVDLLGQEIIHDYQIKEFDLTNLHPDTKYLICFRVTRKRFIGSTISSSVLYNQNNDTKTTSSIHQKKLLKNDHLQSTTVKQTNNSNHQMITYKTISSLNRSNRIRQSINMPRMNDEYVAEMECQVTFTRFLHWTALLCSLIGIIIALLLSITIFFIMKSRADKTKKYNRKMCLNQKGQLLLVGRRTMNGVGEDDEEEDNLSNCNKLHHFCHHPHPHHHHHHHHHFYQHHHLHHSQHQHYHSAHQHTQNHHIHYHCRNNSSSKKSSLKQEHCIQRYNQNKTNTLSSPFPLSSLSTSISRKSPDKLETLSTDKSSRIVNVPSEVIEDNEIHISKQQLEDWENTLKNIEEADNTVMMRTNDKICITSTKPIVACNTNDNLNVISNPPVMDGIKIPESLEIDRTDSLVFLSENIESVKVMGNKRTVSFKDDTTTNTTNDSSSSSDTTHWIVLHTDVNSIQLDSTDSHNDEFSNFHKPISISITESSLMNDLKAIESDYNKVEHITCSKTSSSSCSNNRHYLQHTTNTNNYSEIQSPLLKDFEQWSNLSPVYTLDNDTDKHFVKQKVVGDDNSDITDNLSNKQNTNTTSLQISTITSSIDRNSTVTMINNKPLLIDISSTDNVDDNGKHIISTDESWFLTSTSKSSSKLMNNYEQKSIFYAQLVETL